MQGGDMKKRDKTIERRTNIGGENNIMRRKIVHQISKVYQIEEKIILARGKSNQKDLGYKRHIISRGDTRFLRYIFYYKILNKF